MSAKKIGITYIISMLIHLYTTFVLQHLWNWFVVNALHAPEISYWVMYGIVLMLQLVFYRSTFEDEQRWNWLEIVLTRCVPDERREEVSDELDRFKEQLTLQVGLMIFSVALGNTITLAIGWGVHTFLS
jgi:hypothetical protein